MDHLAVEQYEPMLPNERWESAAAHRSFESELVIRPNWATPRRPRREHSRELGATWSTRTTSVSAHPRQSRDHEVATIDAMLDKRLQVAELEHGSRIERSPWWRRDVDAIRTSDDVGLRQGDTSGGSERLALGARALPPQPRRECPEFWATYGAAMPLRRSGT